MRRKNKAQQVPYCEELSRDRDCTVRSCAVLAVVELGTRKFDDLQLIVLEQIVIEGSQHAHSTPAI